MKRNRRKIINRPKERKMKLKKRVRFRMVNKKEIEKI